MTGKQGGKKLPGTSIGESPFGGSTASSGCSCGGAASDSVALLSLSSSEGRKVLLSGSLLKVWSSCVGDGSVT